MPYVALRMGDLKFRGWTLNARQLPADQPEMKITSEHLVPNVHQKGVDMRVGLDIASLTLKNNNLGTRASSPRRGQDALVPKRVPCASAQR